LAPIEGVIFESNPRYLVNPSERADLLLGSLVPFERIVFEPNPRYLKTTFIGGFLIKD
jgi:hypothetical protein